MVAKISEHGRVTCCWCVTRKSSAHFPHERIGFLNQSTISGGSLDSYLSTRHLLVCLQPWILRHKLRRFAKSRGQPAPHLVLAIECWISHIGKVRAKGSYYNKLRLFMGLCQILQCILHNLIVKMPYRAFATANYVKTPPSTECAHQLTAFLLNFLPRRNPTSRCNISTDAFHEAVPQICTRKMHPSNQHSFIPCCHQWKQKCRRQWRKRVVIGCYTNTSW